MIKILYDGGGVFEPHGGVSRCFTEIMKRLERYGCAYELSVVGTGNSYLRNAPFNIPPYKQSVHDFVRDYCGGRYFPGVGHVYRFLGRVLPSSFPSGEISNEKALSDLLTKGEFDVYHPTAPHYINGLSRSVVGRKPIVITVHDMIPELYGRDEKVRRNRRIALASASKVIAVSENTKKDILANYDIPESKIAVVYHGFITSSLIEKNILRIECSNLKRDTPYILYVGKRNGYKNFQWLVGAVANLLKGGFRLVCTGVPFSAEENTFLEKLGVAACVEQKFFTDAEMCSLYAGAIAFVYPSLYEGFGILILESYSARCPVILSRSSCFPEVAGDAALYFEPGDADELCRHIESLASDSALRNRMIARGISRLSKFSWDKCAVETARVYHDIVG